MKLTDQHVREVYKKSLGKYCIGKINANGMYLLEFAKLHQLKLTNTLFRHKTSHMNTWECPERITPHNDKNTNTVRRNPYRNQIDYILVRE